VLAQRAEGLVDEATWSRAAAIVRLYLATPGGRAWWRSHQIPLSPAFGEWAERELAALEAGEKEA
jgi:hypothetical protein